MLKVHLVYFSHFSDDGGLCGDGSYTKPELVSAFTTPNKARNWVRKQRKQLAPAWQYKFSHKILKVT